MLPGQMDTLCTLYLDYWIHFVHSTWTMDTHCSHYLVYWIHFVYSTWTIGYTLYTLPGLMGTLCTLCLDIWIHFVHSVWTYVYTSHTLPKLTPQEILERRAPSISVANSRRKYDVFMLTLLLKVIFLSKQWEVKHALDAQVNLWYGMVYYS